MIYTLAYNLSEFSNGLYLPSAYIVRDNQLYLIKGIKSTRLIQDLAFLLA